MHEPRIAAGLPDWIRDHLQRYLETNGQDGHLWDATLGGGTGLCPTLLLTTTGRKSREPLTLPLIYGRVGEAFVVVASKGGAPAHPAWYLNLEADPEVGVQVLADRFTARARTAEGAERSALWNMMVEVYHPYEKYQAATTREIPVVVLERV